MKTNYLTSLIGMLLLIGINIVQAQSSQSQFSKIKIIKPESKRPVSKAYQRPQDNNNFNDFINRVGKNETDRLTKLKALKGQQLKSVLAGEERLDSTIYEYWDTISGRWRGSYKTRW